MVESSTNEEKLDSSTVESSSSVVNLMVLEGSVMDKGSETNSGSSEVVEEGAVVDVLLVKKTGNVKPGVVDLSVDLTVRASVIEASSVELKGSVINSCSIASVDEVEEAVGEVKDKGSVTNSGSSSSDVEDDV